MVFARLYVRTPPLSGERTDLFRTGFSEPLTLSPPKGHYHAPLGEKEGHMILSIAIAGMVLAVLALVVGYQALSRKAPALPFDMNQFRQDMGAEVAARPTFQKLQEYLEQYFVQKETVAKHCFLKKDADNFVTHEELANLVSALVKCLNAPITTEISRIETAMQDQIQQVQTRKATAEQKLQEVTNMAHSDYVRSNTQIREKVDSDLRSAQGAVQTAELALTNLTLDPAYVRNAQRLQVLQDQVKQFDELAVVSLDPDGNAKTRQIDPPGA